MQYGVIDLKNESETLAAFQSIGVSQPGFGYMLPKALFCCLKFKDIPCRAANVLKQEMLARGGEAAVHEASLYGEGTTDVILMGTYRQYELLAGKLRLQPFKSLQAMAEAIDDCIEGLKTSAFSIKCPNQKELNLSASPKIMGILNITPDSFSDGGRYLKAKSAVEKAWQLHEAGADIIDLGAVSTRPGGELASAEAEWERLEPVLKELGRENLILSLDTFRADIARKGLELGVSIINDIGGLMMDEQMAEVVAEYQAPVVVMENRMQFNRRPYEDLMLDIAEQLKQSLQTGVQQGIAVQQMMIDPGIGFGKTIEENWEIVRRLGELRALGRPILLALSRKSFLQKTMPEADRDEVTAMAGLVGVMNGAALVRVHEVEKMKTALQVAGAVRGKTYG